MPAGVESSCTNHPAIEAVGRCKQCGKPFCHTCEIKGPTGRFCSAACKESHEKFTARAAELDKLSKSGSLMARVIGLIKKLLFWAALVLIVAAILTYFGIEVPVLSNLVRGIASIFT